MYQIIERNPTVMEYHKLLRSVGWSEKNEMIRFIERSAVGCFKSFSCRQRYKHWKR